MMRWLKGEVLPFLFKLTDLQSCDHNLFFLLIFPLRLEMSGELGARLSPSFSLGQPARKFNHTRRIYSFEIPQL